MYGRVSARFYANLTKALLIIVAGGGSSSVGALNAAEPSSWFVGAGVGAGATHTDIKYSDSSKNGLGLNFAIYNIPPDVSAKSWGVAYELLVGYKHFLNDFVGFRYYANVGAQHYQDATFSGGKDKIGIIEYTANADLLVNFYTDSSFSIGLFGGFGVGGATFDNALLEQYERDWGAAIDATRYMESIYKDIGKTYRHHFSANASVGARVNFFQQLRSANLLNCSTGSGGRRSCHKPSNTHLEHSIEVAAKFPMLTYYATKAGEVVPTKLRFEGTAIGTIEWFRGVRERPGYTIKNPYRFTVRYILAF